MWLLIVVLVDTSSTCGSPGWELNWLSATVPLPPGRLTTLTGTSTSLYFWMRCWRSRAVRSLVPPGAFGAIRVMGRVGFQRSCAAAGSAAATDIRQTVTTRITTVALAQERRAESISRKRQRRRCRNVSRVTCHVPRLSLVPLLDLRAGNDPANVAG